MDECGSWGLGGVGPFRAGTRSSALDRRQHRAGLISRQEKEPCDSSIHGDTNRFVGHMVRSTSMVACGVSGITVLEYKCNVLRTGDRFEPEPLVPAFIQLAIGHVYVLKKYMENDMSSQRVFTHGTVLFSPLRRGPAGHSMP